MFNDLFESRGNRNKRHVHELKICHLRARRTADRSQLDIRQLEKEAVEQAKTGQTDRARGTVRSMKRMMVARRAIERRADMIRDWVLQTQQAVDDQAVASVLGGIARDLHVNVNHLPQAINDFVTAMDVRNEQDDVWREAESVGRDTALSTLEEGLPDEEALMQEVLARAGAEQQAAAISAPAKEQAQAADETAALREKAQQIIQQLEK